MFSYVIGLGAAVMMPVILDLASAYAVPALKSLLRTFTYDRAAGAFTVTDRVEFSEPTAFESSFNTYLESANASGKVNNGRVRIGWNVRKQNLNFKHKKGERTCK